MLDCVIDCNHTQGFNVNGFHEMQAAGILGLIHKCTEGLYFTDDAYHMRMGRAAVVGFLYAGYHFASSEDGTAQAEFYYEHADNPGADVLDFETNKRGTMTKAGAEHFTERLETLSGRWPILYLNESTLHDLNITAASPLAQCRLWVAKYGGARPKLPLLLAEHFLWQASGTEPDEHPRTCPGVIGAVDRSFWPGTADELKAWWGT